MADGIDANIYAQAGRPAVALQDPVNMLAQVASAKNQVNQLAAFRAQTAAGQALQQATNPNTGRVDPLAFQRLAAADPEAAQAMAQVASQGQGLQGAQQDVANKKMAFAADALGGLMSANGGQGPTHDQVLQTLQRGASLGILNQADAASVLAGMPTGDDPRSTATRLHIIQTMNEQLQSAQQRLQNVGGAPTDINNGGTIQPAMRAGLLSRTPGAVMPTGAGFQLTTGPETNAALVETYVPDPQHPGQYNKVMVPRGTLPGASGTPGTMVQPGGANNPLGTGRYSQQAAPPPAAPPGTVLAAPPTAGVANNAADVQAYKQAQLAVPSVNNSIQNLQHAYDALQLTNAGKSTETTHAMYSLLNAQGLLPQGLADDVKNYDLFKKYTERYIADAGNASGTDAGRALAAASNAGTGLSTAANNEVLRNEIGRQRQALVQIAEAPDKQGIGYGSHAENFSSKVDPRGFAIDMYTPAEVKKLVESMPNNEARDRFYRAAGMARRLKMVSAPTTAPVTPRVAPQAPPQAVPQVPTGD